VLKSLPTFPEGTVKKQSIWKYDWKALGVSKTQEKIKNENFTFPFKSTKIINESFSALKEICNC
jgi:hypothetical protein